MSSSAFEFIDRTHDMKSLAELKGALLRAVQSDGFENAVFARVQNRRLVAIPWSEFPPGYLATYKEGGWDRIDPVVQRIQSANRPFRWSDLHAQATFSKEQRAFFVECKGLGVHSGVTIPIRGGPGEVDLVSLSMRERGAVPRDDLGDVYMMSVQYWIKYRELSGGLDATHAKLTNQELEALRWCREGKTNWEIGEIMLISEKTVEFHLSNLMRKLGASNRITAVVAGIRRGLISL